MNFCESRDAIEYKKALAAYAARVQKQVAVLKDWDEAKHPRDEKGRFTYTGFSSGSFTSPSGAFEVTQDVMDMYLTDTAREKISAAIGQVKTAKDLEAYLSDKGIELCVDYAPLQSRMDDEIPAVKEQADFIIAAVESYDELGGLSALEAVHIYNPSLNAQAEYSYQATGEGAVTDKGHLYLSDRCNGFQIMHEFAHAYADSTRPSNMDVVEWSAELNKRAGLASTATAYFGASQDALEAERFADTVGAALCNGDTEKLDFVANVANIAAKQKR